MDPTVIDTFHGINNVADPSRLKAGELVKAVNVDIDKTGGIRQRGGRELIFAGNCRSVFGSSQGLLFACRERLCLMDQQFQVHDLRVDLDPNLSLTFAEVAGELFYSNSVVNGSIRNGRSEPWGPPVPDPPALSLESGGHIPPGRYRAVVTFYDADGRESGASEESNVLEFLEAANSLVITPPVMPDGVTAIGVYLSSGTHFFRVGFNQSSFPIRVDVFNQSDPLQTPFSLPAPPGHIIRAYQGRVYIAFEQWLFYSEPAPNYHLFSEENAFEFENRLRMVEPVADGLYVSDGSTFFMMGTNPEEMTVTEVSKPSVIPGSSMVMDSSQLGVEGIQGKVAVWFAEKTGLLVGLPNANGTILNLMAGKFAVPSTTSGAVSFRDFNGIKQLLTSFPAEKENSFGASDLASCNIKVSYLIDEYVDATDTITIEVFRNNILLEA